MAAKKFGRVWYRPDENCFWDKSIIAMRDAGTLQVSDDSLDFHGTKAQVHISGIKRISYVKQGGDFVNHWVKIEYGGGKTAFIADGRWLGWAGIFGGTRKILNTVRHLDSSS